MSLFIQQICHYKLHRVYVRRIYTNFEQITGI